MDLVYNLGRSVLRVTGTGVRRWNIATARPTVDPLAFKGEIVLVADGRNLRAVDLASGSGWSKLTLDIALTDDGRLTSASRTMAGGTDEAVLAVVKGFVAGISSPEQAADDGAAADEAASKEGGAIAAGSEGAVSESDASARAKPQKVAMKKSETKKAQKSKAKAAKQVAEGAVGSKSSGSEPIKKSTDDGSATQPSDGGAGGEVR